MRFLFLIFSFLFVFGSFHSVHAQEADKTQIEDDIFGLEADFDFEKPEKTPYAEKLSKIVEMEHGYYGDMIIHGQKITHDNNLWEYFVQSAFDDDVNLYGGGQGFHFNEAYPKTQPYNRALGIPDDVREQMKLSDVRQHFMDVDREHFSNIMDVDYIIKNVKGVPKHKVLNRWEKETITVSIITGETYYSEPDIYGIIYNELFRKIKSLNEKTNLNIVYEEGLGKKADIIFLTGGAAEILVRSSTGYVPKIERVLYGDVRFPSGYIIPNQNNEILKAYCSIHLPRNLSHREYLTRKKEGIIEDLDEGNINAIKANIEICLLRSLGLTGEVDKKGLMFVKYEEPFSALTDIPDYKVSKGEIVFDPKELIAIRNKTMSENDDFFMFDLIVLKLLYCDLYKPQMDLNEAQFYYPSCFLQAVDFREKEKQE